jgi:hypothetical protein
MKWFDQWFSRKSREVWENAAKKESQREQITMFSSGLAIGKVNPVIDGNLNRFPDLIFKMHGAENGHIIEVQHMDHKTHENKTKMYLVHDGEDLGEAISKIITLETLRL